MCVAEKRRGLSARMAVVIFLVVAGLTWLLVNHPVEGRVLVIITPTHGLTTADLPSMAAFVLAALLVWRRPGGR
ncbi:MAG: hypothetical protein JWP61_290 [Friedmanniella sp.]|nr:hypothetical protein [Friedmanniella sp.]